MTLLLTCAFQVIKVPNERVIALFHYFFLQFLHIAESVKHHNFKTPVPVISQILTTFNLYYDRPIHRLFLSYFSNHEDDLQSQQL